MRLLSGAEAGQWLTKHLPKASRLIVVSPFITEAGMRPVRQRLADGKPFELIILTSVELMPALLGALNLSLLAELLADDRVRIEDVKGLHAKVFVIDDDRAVFGSANLTSHGMGGGNIELGAELSGAVSVRPVLERVATWRQREPLSAFRLNFFLEAYEESKKKFAESLGAWDPSALPRFPTPEPMEDSYYAGVCAVLSFVRLADGRQSRDVLAMMVSDRMQTETEEPERRLRFLRYLGLVERSTDRSRPRINITKLGRAVRLVATGKRTLLNTLLEKSPDVRWAYDAFVSESGYLTYEQLEERARHIRVRIATIWLRSLGVVTKRQGASPHQFRLNRRLKLADVS